MVSVVVVDASGPYGNPRNLTNRRFDCGRYKKRDRAVLGSTARDTTENFH